MAWPPSAAPSAPSSSSSGSAGSRPRPPATPPYQTNPILPLPAPPPPPPSPRQLMETTRTTAHRQLRTPETPGASRVSPRPSGVAPYQGFLRWPLGRITGRICGLLCYHCCGACLPCWCSFHIIDPTVNVQGSCSIERWCASSGGQPPWRSLKAPGGYPPLLLRGQ